jgi:hypothetical protein
MLSKVCDRSRIHKVEDYLHSSPATSPQESTFISDLYRSHYYHILLILIVTMKLVNKAINKDGSVCDSLESSAQG